MNGTLISSMAVIAVILIMLSLITIPLLLGSVIYILKTKKDQETKKKLKIVLLVLVGFYLVTIIFSLSVNKLGLGSREDRLDYAKQTDLGQLFLEYYPEAQTEFNAAGDLIRFYHEENERSIYIHVPAMKYREGDGGTLYCYDGELIFEVTEIDEMREKLESQECFE